MKTNKLTVAERRARAAEELQLARAKFEEEREALWFRLFATALHVQALYQQHPDSIPENEKQRTVFRLDASAETFTLSWANEPYSKATLSPDNCDMLQREMDDRKTAVQAALAENQRLRDLRQAAMGKLTEEEKLALGFTPSALYRRY